MSSVTSADGTTIAFTARGSGPAVVLVDGAMSYRAFSPTLAAIAEGLADRRTVYTYDRRGRGESTNAGTGTVQEQLDDLAALIEHAGGSAALVGFSSGAVLALEAALAGAPVTALALYEPPFVVSDDRPPVADDYRDRLLAAVAAGRPGDAVAQFLTEAATVPAEYVEPMRSEPYWPGMEQVAPTLAHDAAVMGRMQSGDPAEVERYAAVGVPTLVLHGGASPAWLAAGATTLAGVLANAEHRVLPDQTHDVAADAIIPVLAEWRA